MTSGSRGRRLARWLGGCRARRPTYRWPQWRSTVRAAHQRRPGISPARRRYLFTDARIGHRVGGQMSYPRAESLSDIVSVDPWNRREVSDRDASDSGGESPSPAPIVGRDRLLRGRRGMIGTTKAGVAYATWLTRRKSPVLILAIDPGSFISRGDRPGDDLWRRALSGGRDLPCSLLLNRPTISRSHCAGSAFMPATHSTGRIEQVFPLGRWVDESMVRRFDPPRPVEVDWSRIDPHAGRPYGFAKAGVSLRVRAAGAHLHARMPGRQIAWLRLTDGQWRAVVDIEIASANGQSALMIRILVEPDAPTVAGDQP
jgi:hypothetical protein